MAAPILYLDLETYSEVPITNGTHAYAEHAEILLIAWAIDDGPVQVWDCTDESVMPRELNGALGFSTIVAHNSQFDRIVLEHQLKHTMRARWQDTMVQALAHSLTGSLGELCDILRIPTDKAKDKEGRQLVHRFCKPTKRNGISYRADSISDPEAWAKFVEYARLDVEAMREVHKRLPSWNYRGAELMLWLLDQRINDRGFAVDVELARAAIDAVDAEQKKLAARTQELTAGDVQAATQRDAMLRHMLATYDVALPDLQQSTLERRINDPDLPAELRELLAIRLQASTTSTSKYKRLATAVSSDGRLRGTLQFCGASRTGRWAGRLFQPQNLPRPALKQAAIDNGIEALKAGVADLVTENVMELTSSAIRGCIVAAPGKKLVVADLSNIEGRVLAWLAGEGWKLHAFRAYDAGTGHDLYKLAYSKSFGVRPETVTGDQRQVGKVQELALGYEGGVGAFLTFAAAYRLDLEEMAEQAFDSISLRIREEAASALEWTREQKRPTFGLSDRAWIVCDSFKRAWRYGHPATASFWRELQDAAILAVNRPGKAVPCRRLVLQRDASWLRIQLPSGRYLCYPSPRIDDDGKLSYMGVNQYSRKWSRLHTYGGKLVENVTQAVARDVLASSMQAIEDANYPIVLTVHDEVLTEPEDSPEYSASHLAELMTTNPSWADGLPLAAAGFEAYRYRKD
ncbi:MAG: DNA polymerase I [Ramlibacter sp.]|nr:DNA polymerase I [Ramlibacter sp.]